MKDTLRFFKLPRSKIVEFNYLLAGYEGMGIVRTVDRERGIIEVLLAPDFEDEFNELVREIASEFQLEELGRPEGSKSILDDGT